MESLPDLKLIKYHPNTLTYMRKQYNLDKPGEMDQAIDILDEWIKKQKHFTVKEFPRSYLERQIILDKGSIERTKLQIEKLFTLKSLLPHFYAVNDVKKAHALIKESFINALMPKLTEDHYRVYIARNLVTFNSKTLTLCYNLGTCLFEYVRANEYCNGFVTVLDYRYINITDFIGVLNINEFRQFITLLMEGYQMRLKAIHIITASKAVELIVKIFKQVFSAKIGQRIQVHMTLESLHREVPKELLPEDLGGDQKLLSSLDDDLIEAMSTKENQKYLIEIYKARVEENLRTGPTHYKEEDLGLTGTFRTLSVD